MKPTIQVCALDGSKFILNYSNFAPDEMAMLVYVTKQLQNPIVKTIEIKKFGGE